MKIYIPRLGDSIKLAADWTFQLYDEERNSTLMEVIGDTRDTGWFFNKQLTSIPCTIPAGTVLKIDRIFIRKGSPDFDSITFSWPDRKTIACEKPRKVAVWRTQGSPMESHIIMDKIRSRTVRFWAKLDDVNTIEFE